MTMAEQTTTLADLKDALERGETSAPQGVRPEYAAPAAPEIDDFGRAYSTGKRKAN